MPNEVIEVHRHTNLTLCSQKWLWSSGVKIKKNIFYKIAVALLHFSIPI